MGAEADIRALSFEDGVKDAERRMAEQMGTKELTPAQERRGNEVACQKLRKQVAEKELKEKIIEILASCLSDNDVMPRATEIFTAFEEAGYVKLAEDQSLPNPYGKVAYERLKAVLEDHRINEELEISVVGETQQDMLEASWRRVEVKKWKS